MKITPEIIDLVCQLEFLVGKETVNKKSCGSYKYPLTVKVYNIGSGMSCYTKMDGLTISHSP